MTKPETLVVRGIPGFTSPGLWGPQVTPSEFYDFHGAASVTLEGANLGAPIKNELQVFIGLSPCSVSFFNSTAVQCELDGLTQIEEFDRLKPEETKNFTANVPGSGMYGTIGR